MFSGIGGFDKGMEDAGIEIAWQCEISGFCRRILRQHWPEVKRYRNVYNVEEFPYVDVLFGGFPCQPVSLAGKRQDDDERWLWPEFHRVITQMHPPWVVIENVEGLQSKGLGDILKDLASCGYDAEWDCLPASAFGAPHIRFRFFIVAYPREKLHRGPRVFDEKWEERFVHRDYVASYAAIREGHVRRVCSSAKAAERKVGITRLGITHGRSWVLEPDVDRVADGSTVRVDRITALGNAVVPRVAEWVGRRIIEYAA